MADIADLERRITALEADVKADRRDIRQMLQLQERAVAIGEATHSRVVANELTASANARTTERGFAEMGGRIGRVEAEVASLRRDLPGMIAGTLREVLKEQRGE